MDEIAEQVRRQFDAGVQRYLRWTPSAQFQGIMRWILANSLTSRTKGILEVGCGHGTWLEFILNNVPDAARLEFFGIDISQARIMAAQRRLKSFQNVHLMTDDIASYRPSRKFDLILFAEVLAYIPSAFYDRIFARCHELLEPEGVLSIVDKDRWSVYALTIAFKRALGQLPPEFQYVLYPSFHDLKRIAGQTGFAVHAFAKTKEFRGLVLCKGEV